MYKEEKKAIEILKVKYLSEYLDDEEVKSLFKHIEKQDKMIDYMADEMIMTRLMTTEEYKTHKYREYSNGQIVMSKKEKIEYFRKRVEEDGKE